MHPIAFVNIRFMHFNKTVLYHFANKHDNYPFSLIRVYQYQSRQTYNKRDEERNLNNLIANERDCVQFVLLYMPYFN